MEGKVEKLNCIRATQTHFYCWLHLLLVCLKLWEKRKKAKHSAVASHMPHACQQPDSEGGQYVRLTALHWHLAEQQTSNRRKQQLLDNNQQKIAVSTMCGKNLHRIKSNLEGSAALVYLGIGSRHKPPVRNELCGLCIHETNEGCVYFLFFASHFCVHNMSHFHITFMLQHH